MRSFVALAVAGLLGSVPAIGLAETADVRLAYQRGDGAGECPDSAWVTAQVQRRLGYELAADAKVTLSATVEQTEAGSWVAVVEWIEADGSRSGRRELTADGQCQELASAVVLAMALAIDPDAAAREPPPDEKPPPPEKKQEDKKPRVAEATPAGRALEASASKPAVPAADREPIFAVVTTGFYGTAGAAPGLSPGFVVGGGARRGRLALSIEARANAPRSADVSGSDGQIRASVAFASLVPCAHHSSLSGCGVISGGLVRATGDMLDGARTLLKPYAAAGARGAWRARLSDRVDLELGVDFAVALSRTTVTVSGADVWRQPAVSGSITAAAVFSLGTF